MRRPLSLLLPLVVLMGCATKTTYIAIVQPDGVGEFGRPKFAVQPGDQLEVLGRKTCRRGAGECWEVRDVKTGQTGFVVAARMRDLHRVYRVPKGAPPVPPEPGAGAAQPPLGGVGVSAAEPTRAEVAPAGEKPPSGAIRIGGRMAQPRLVHKVVPRHPGADGLVMIEAEVDEHGFVRSASVLHGTNPQVEEPAVEAVQQWRYEPLLVDGKPTPFILTVTLNFNHRHR